MSVKHAVAEETGGYDDELWEQRGGRVDPTGGQNGSPSDSWEFEIKNKRMT